METKPLLYGIAGFMLGGLLVSVAATTFDKPTTDSGSGQSMGQMTAALHGKKGDEFDRAFITGMIEHHEGAITMAELAAANAGHVEIKQLSTEIISAQKKEIDQMMQWQKQWGYPAQQDSSPMGH